MSENYRAITAITSLVANTLGDESLIISVGRPSSQESGVFLYLYNVHVDEHLRNVPLDEGQDPPLWLVLKYLLIINNPSRQGHQSSLDLLGKILRRVHTHFHLAYSDSRVEMGLQGVLTPIRQEFKLSIEELSADTVSRILPQADAPYSCGIGLQVRPLPLLPETLPRFSQLVGVDYRNSPSQPFANNPQSASDGREFSITTMVAPASLSVVQPGLVAPGEEFLIRGENLNQAPLENSFLEVSGKLFPLIAQTQSEIRANLSAQDLVSNQISAANHDIRMVYIGEDLKKRYSNSLSLRLVPSIHSVKINESQKMFNDQLEIEVEGVLLGSPQDEVQSAIMKNGEIRASSQDVYLPPFEGEGSDSYQKTTLLSFGPQSLPQDQYIFIYRVNGQQALVSPQLMVE